LARAEEKMIKKAWRFRWIFCAYLGGAVVILGNIRIHQLDDTIGQLEQYNKQLQDQVTQLCAMIPPLEVSDLKTENGAEIRVQSTVICEPIKRPK
jgi:predicted Zn-dependent protease